MANPNPSPETRFQPGNKAGRGVRPGKRSTTVLLELIAERGCDREIAEKWLAQILAGDFRFFQEYLNRTEGKVPDRIAGPGGERLFGPGDLSKLSPDDLLALRNVLARLAEQPDGRDPGD